MPESAPLDRILAVRQARPGQVVDVDGPMVKLVVFTLGDMWFAFPGEKIREVLAETPVFFLPCCPATLEGVMNVRGTLESIVRLRPLLGLGEGPEAKSSRILIGQTPSMRSGIRVDRVEEVLDVPVSGIHPPPGAVSDRMKALLLGITDFQGHPVHVLDLDRIFEDLLAELR